MKGRSGTMFWASITDSKIIGLFKFSDGIKVNTENYYKFLDKCCRSQTKSFKLKCIFMQNNAPLHSIKSEYCPPCQKVHNDTKLIK